MVSVKFYLKSRNTIKFKCEQFSIRQNNFGTITGYEFEGLKGEYPYVSLNDIEAITVANLDT